MTHKLNMSQLSPSSSRNLTCLRVKRDKLQLTPPIQIDRIETPRFPQAEASSRETLSGNLLAMASYSLRTSTQKITLRWSRSERRLSLTKRNLSKRKSPRSLKRSWSRQGLSSAKMLSSKSGLQKNRKKSKGPKRSLSRSGKRLPQCCSTLSRITSQSGVFCKEKTHTHLHLRGTLTTVIEMMALLKTVFLQWSMIVTKAKMSRKSNLCAIASLTISKMTRSQSSILLTVQSWNRLGDAIDSTMEALPPKLILKTSSDKNISWAHLRKQLRVPHLCAV